MEKDPMPGVQAYSAAVANMLKQNRLMPLGQGTPDESIMLTLRSLSTGEAFAPREVVDETFVRLCFAGIWLLHDHLEECHKIAQQLETREAAYWHAIMHRREGDFSNSKYWFRRVGDHPSFALLCEEAKRLAMKSKLDNSTSFLANQSQWDPFCFVDLCEACVKGRVSAEDLCRQIQHVEWQLLFDYCYRKAIGG